jgi:hypothetical protein
MATIPFGMSTLEHHIPMLEAGPAPGKKIVSHRAIRRQTGGQRYWNKLLAPFCDIASRGPGDGTF